MSITPKNFLAVSITTFALSFAPFFTDLIWGILRPVSAVTFIIFIITHMLAREMALYDEEQRRGSGTLNQNNITEAPSRDQMMRSMKRSTAK